MPIPRAIYFRPQVTRFVILFVERSGSTYLSTLLNAHPDILALREQFAVLRQKGKGPQDQLEWAQSFLTPPLIGRHAALGFKTKLVDVLDPDGFVQLLQRKRCKIIQLQRRNTVKGVVSTINARRLWEVSGNWNLLNESDRRPPFTIDPDEFDDLLRFRETWDRDLESFVKRLQLPTLLLYYEDLLQDENAFLQQGFAFLAVKPKPAQGRTLKHTSDNLREVIINFHELRANYIGTPYEPMFDEVVAGPSPKPD